MKNIFLTTGAVAMLSFNAFADGKDDYTSAGCAACHGANGISITPTYPNLAGQKSAYTAKQIKAFQDGTRSDPTMNAMAMIVKGKEKAIADYLAGLK